MKKSLSKKIILGSILLVTQQSLLSMELEKTTTKNKLVPIIYSIPGTNEVIAGHISPSDADAVIRQCQERFPGKRLIMYVSILSSHRDHIREVVPLK